MDEQVREDNQEPQDDKPTQDAETPDTGNENQSQDSESIDPKEAKKGEVEEDDTNEEGKNYATTDSTEKVNKEDPIKNTKEKESSRVDQESSDELIGDQGEFKLDQISNAHQITIGAINNFYGNRGSFEFDQRKSNKDEVNNSQKHQKETNSDKKESKDTGNNFYGNKGNFNFYQGNSETYKDPTKPFNAYIRKSDLISEKTIKKYSSILRRDRLILVSTYSKRLLYAASSTIIRKMDVDKSYDVRFLEFQGENEENMNLSPRTLIEQSIGEGERQIFLVDLINKESAFKFSERLVKSIGRGEQLQDSLRKKEVYIICRFSSSEQIDFFDSNKNLHDFPEWRLNITEYIQLLLRSLFPREEQWANKIFNDIQEQKEYGIYGGSNDFEQALSQLLENQPANISTIVNNNAIEMAIGREKGKEKKEEVTAQVLIDSSPIAKEILYAACFLPKLHLREFRKVIDFILTEKGNCTIKVEEDFITKKGKKKKHTLSKEVNALSHFEEHSDTIFQKLHLEEVITEGNNTVVDFNLPSLRKKVFTALKLKYSNFCLKQSRKIVYESGFLLDVSTDETIVSKVIKLSIDLSLADPINRVGKEILWDIGLGVKITESQPINSTQFLSSGFQNFERLNVLIVKFLEHESLRPIIRDFFQELLKTEEGAMLLLYILDSQIENSSLDILEWVKIAFDDFVNHDMIEEKASEVLITMSNKNNLNIYDFLERLKGWLPNEADKDRLSNHSSFGLTFLYWYSSLACIKLPKKYYGEFPSRYYLFSSLQKPNEPEVEKKIEGLIIWLFHPKLDGVFFNNSFNFSRKKIRTNADLIEYWSLILLGDSKEKKIQPEAEKLVKLILVQTKKYANKATQRNLRAVWIQKAQFYLLKGAELPFHEIKEKEVWKYRRNNLKKILKIFDKNE